MPIHVEVSINTTQIDSIHIGRVRGGTDPDDINDYLVVHGDRPTRLEDWHIDGIPFRHRYGDGALICVKRGIEAIHGIDTTIVSESAYQQLLTILDEPPKVSPGLKDLFEKHPPQSFRDIANGE
jgi:hypothetical protein